MKNVIRFCLMTVLITFSVNSSAMVKWDGEPKYKRAHEHTMPSITIERKNCWAGIGCGKHPNSRVDITFIPKDDNPQKLRKSVEKLKKILISIKLNHQNHYPGCGHNDEPGKPSNDVPEPGILGLIAVGLLGMVAVRRKKPV